MPLDILAIGEPLYELNQAGASGAFLPGFGGDTSNVAVAAARSGARAGYCSAVGEDAFGAAFLDLWAREGVDTGAVAVDPHAPTGLYFVTHGPEGHAFTYRRAGSAASLVRPHALPRDVVAGARVLHASGISLAISTSAADTVFAAIEVARGAGNTVSFDTNLRPKLWPIDRARAVTHEAMRLAHVALPGLDDARALTGLEAADDVADFYLRLGAGVVALTLGREGCLVATPTTRRRIAAIPVAAVDATGAGDTFDGAFLAEWLATGDPFAAGRYANAAAALSTTGYGAVAPMPTRAMVEALLARSGEG